MTTRDRTWARRSLALVVGGVWVHQGLWCKVLGRRPDHEAIVADLPGVGPGRARSLTVAIGAVETALAGWIVSGWGPRHAAAAQTALLLGMNGGGLLFAAGRIPDARRMLRRNAGFLAAIWAVPTLSSASD